MSYKVSKHIPLTETVEPTSAEDGVTPERETGIVSERIGSQPSDETAVWVGSAAGDVTIRETALLAPLPLSTVIVYEPAPKDFGNVTGSETPFGERNIPEYE